ncbi:hypothetical protein R6Q57_013597 [Mikania cordata]
MGALKKLATEPPEEPGFKYVVTGDKYEEKISAILLCAGYLKSNDCASCVNNAIPQLLQKCPNQKIAVAWKGVCMVRLRPFVKYEYDVWFVTHEISTVKAKDVNGLDKALSILSGNLAKKAYQGQPMAYAFGSQPYGSPSVEVYMVVQCTLGISSEECDRCFIRIFREMKPCCSGSTEAIILTPHCYMRYAHHDFRNL